MYAAVLLLTVSSWQNWSPRYILAIFPLLAYLAAGGWQWITDRAPRGWRRGLAAAGLALLLLVQPAWKTAQELRHFSSPDARLLAFAWLEENLPEGATLARDPYTPDFASLEHPFRILEANPYVLATYTVADLQKSGLPVVVTTLDLESESAASWVDAQEIERFRQLYRLAATIPKDPVEAQGRPVYIYMPGSNAP